eukprot:7161467-Prymnesium_polylepis.2
MGVRGLAFSLLIQNGAASSQLALCNGAVLSAGLARGAPMLQKKLGAVRVRGVFMRSRARRSAC